MSGIDSDSAQSQSSRSYFFGNLQVYQQVSAWGSRTKEKSSAAQKPRHVTIYFLSSSLSRHITFRQLRARERDRLPMESTENDRNRIIEI